MALIQLRLHPLSYHRLVRLKKKWIIDVEKINVEIGGDTKNLICMEATPHPEVKPYLMEDKPPLLLSVARKIRIFPAAARASEIVENEFRIPRYLRPGVLPQEAQEKLSMLRGYISENRKDLVYTKEIIDLSNTLSPNDIKALKKLLDGIIIPENWESNSQVEAFNQEVRNKRIKLLEAFESDDLGKKVMAHMDINITDWRLEGQLMSLVINEGVCEKTADHEKDTMNYRRGCIKTATGFMEELYKNHSTKCIIVWDVESWLTEVGAFPQRGNMIWDLSIDPVLIHYLAAKRRKVNKEDFMASKVDPKQFLEDYREVMEGKKLDLFEVLAQVNPMVNHMDRKNGNHRVLAMDAIATEVNKIRRLGTELEMSLASLQRLVLSDIVWRAMMRMACKEGAIKTTKKGNRMVAERFVRATWPKVKKEDDRCASQTSCGLSGDRRSWSWVTG